jgi:hypothetical protein
MKCLYTWLLVLFGSLIATDLAADETGAARDCTRWKASSGNWTDSDRWSDGRPDAYRRVEIHGVSNVPAEETLRQTNVSGTMRGFLLESVDVTEVSWQLERNCLMTVRRMVRSSI